MGVPARDMALRARLKRLGRRRWLAVLGFLGPGLISALAGDDAGGIGTYATAGAAYGYNLLFALLIVTVIDYRETPIGKYVEYSIAIACTHGKKPAPRLLPALFMDFFKAGQYVVDLPVSSEISVKGGKGIWGMPKHQGHLDFNISEERVSSQYDLDGKLVAYVEIEPPKKTCIPVRTKASNYCSFRGMLMKSDIFLDARCGIRLFRNAKARFVIGDHPRLQDMKALEIGEAIATVFLPSITGTLDDHVESWFLDFDQLPEKAPEGMESVVGLGLGEEWLSPPSAPVPPQADGRR